MPERGQAICALPHPGPVHSLASSVCMSHLLTGSDDGYIRDYDIFTALNGKTFLSAPQRHHAGVVEGLMKAGQLYCWWENPAPPSPKKANGTSPVDETPGLSPVYSLAMHSDALWALGGSDVRRPVRFRKFRLSNRLLDRTHKLIHRAARTWSIVSCYERP